MSRRFAAVAVAAGLAMTLMTAPSFAAAQGPSAGSNDKPAQPSPGEQPAQSDPGYPSAVCQPPEKTSVAAPAVNSQATFTAAKAGSVVIGRVDAVTINVVSVTPSEGWTTDTPTATGPRVNVRFIDSGSKLVRFVAQLNKTGDGLYVRVSQCHR